MTWVSLSVSTLASVAQLTLSNQLVAIPEDVLHGASMVSLLTIAGILAAHSFAMMVWLQASPEARRKDAEMEAQAADVDRQITADKTLAASVAKLANEQIKLAIPVLARIQARQRLNGFVVAHGNLPVLESGEVDREAVAALFPELALGEDESERGEALATYGNLEDLVEELVEERLAERERGVLAVPNGHVGMGLNGR